MILSVVGNGETFIPKSPFFLGGFHMFCFRVCSVSCIFGMGLFLGVSGILLPAPETAPSKDGESTLFLETIWHPLGRCWYTPPNFAPERLVVWKDGFPWKQNPAVRFREGI